MQAILGLRCVSKADFKAHFSSRKRFIFKGLFLPCMRLVFWQLHKEILVQRYVNVFSRFQAKYVHSYKDINSNSNCFFILL